MEGKMKTPKYILSENELLKLFTSLVSSVWHDNGDSIDKAQKKYNKWLRANGFDSSKIEGEI